MRLGELGHEGNHEVEKTNGLDESETQNGIREQLATEGGVAGNAVEEGGEDETDTDTGTSQTDGSSTHTQVLGDLDHGLGDLRRVGTALDGESLAGGGVDDGRHLLALDGLEGGRLAGDSQGPLAGVGKRDAGGRASSLGGHLRRQSRGEDTGGGHCDCWEEDAENAKMGREWLALKIEAEAMARLSGRGKKRRREE
jgi:hypothetical protein